MPVKILIVDDHEIVREGIRTLISRSKPEWQICGEANNGEESLAAAGSLQPDVVVLDITMPKMSGLEAASQVAQLCPGCRILMFTMHESESLVNEVRQAGAHGVVLKSQAARDLIRAIERLLSGDTFFASQQIAESDQIKPPPPKIGQIFERSGRFITHYCVQEWSQGHRVLRFLVEFALNRGSLRRYPIAARRAAISAISGGH
jgi:DNA-binding NarL/FixJ family response regulator